MIYLIKSAKLRLREIKCTELPSFNFSKKFKKNANYKLKAKFTVM